MACYFREILDTKRRNLNWGEAMMERFLDAVSSIDSKEKLAEFVALLRDDFVSNPQEWENQNLETYLDALSAWIGSMSNFYRNNNISEDSVSFWQKFATMLLAAKFYE